MITSSTILFSSTSFSEWTKIEIKDYKNSYYIDFDKIKKENGFVFWWDMINFSKSTPEGYLSVRGYKQGDCKLFKFKDLIFLFHKKPMSNGVGDFITLQENWNKPKKHSISEIAIKEVCKYSE